MTTAAPGTRHGGPDAPPGTSTAPGTSPPRGSTSAPHRAWVALRTAPDSAVARDVALLVVRVVLAWIFVDHGARTLFGAFGGPGIAGQARFFGSVAHLHPATFFAVFGGLLELLGGLAVGVGLLGRVAAVGLVGDMLMAMVTVTWRHGLVSAGPGSGYELNLALGALASVVAVLGTGRWSLDRIRFGPRPGRRR